MILSVEQVTISLKDMPIVRDLSLQVEAGSTHAVMGPNGSGKSTLASTLMGHPMYTVTAGTVLFEKSPLLELSPEKRARAGLFLVSQQPPAIPGVQVLIFLKEAHRMLTGTEVSLKDFKEQVYALFDAVKLDHSFLYRTLHEGFSGGEKKRLEMVQLLLFKPKLAILDEIDSGLDVDAVHTISELLYEEQNRGLTLILITHYKRILEFVRPDQVHLMSQGKLIKTDSYRLAEHIDREGYDELLV